MDKTNKFLPNEQNFDMFALGKAVYVDKTHLIHSLFANSAGPFFLSRPRRFGKTLLLDTIKKVAEGDRDLFAGLKINDLEYDWLHYPVIRLNMHGIDFDPRLFKNDLLGLIQPAGTFSDEEIRAKSPSLAINELITKLHLKHKETYPKEFAKNPFGTKNVVLLIDEYDFPLLGNMGNSAKTEIIREILYTFYSSVKSCSSLLRFTFITGITKFRQSSLFSGMNHTEDIYLSSAYSTICGFTMEEIQSTFKKYYKTAIAAMKKKSELATDAKVTDLEDKLLKWYDGYCWDGVSRVINPFSVINLFKHNAFDNYWYNSGASRMTSRNKSDAIDYFRLFENNLSFDTEFPAWDANDISETSILMQAGYLTIDTVSGPEENKTYHLKIPNNEILNAARIELLSRYIVPKGTNSPKKFINEKFMQFINAFGTFDETESESLLSSIFSGIPQAEPKGTDEFFYRGLLRILLGFGNKLTLPEDPSDIGRSDISMQTPDGDWIILEIKHSNAVSDAHTHRNASSRSVKPSSATPGDSGVALISVKGQSGKEDARVLNSLNTDIRKAFSQIVDRHYGRKYLWGSTKVYAAAIELSTGLLS
ncbi:MAG: AAA family ATPase [Deltaproteobacteria bacterium]|jgi:hypothetical protein|nr:AAA family ATPase [Deltaproteobacteria bacterium]